jgi:hypothetical protein
LAENPGGAGVTYASTDGDTKNVTLIYSGTMMSVTVSNTTTGNVGSTNYLVGNIPALLGTNVAYIGFTGGTGGYTATQVIGNFVYAPLAALTSSLSGNTLTLTWPTGAGFGGYVLQQANAVPAVQGGGGWTTASGGTYSTVGGNNQYQVTVAPGAGETFYQLVAP